MPSMSQPEPATETPTTPDPKAGTMGTVIVWVIVAVVAICIGAAVLKNNGGNPNADNAVSACKDNIRAQLKAPSTADFSDERYTDNDPNWYVTGNVDAENSFGAKIRSSFSCNLVRDGDSFTVTSSSVN